jgi:hypothetical protein
MQIRRVSYTRMSGKAEARYAGNKRLNESDVATVVGNPPASRHKTCCDEPKHAHHYESDNPVLATAR